MKRIFTHLLIICAFSLQAQTTIFNANFSNTTGNNAWTAGGTSATQWIITGTNTFAGAGSYLHTAQDVTNNYVGGAPGAGTFTVTSPTINTIGKDRLTLEFRMQVRISTAGSDFDRLELQFESNDLPDASNGNSTALRFFTLGRLQSKEVLSQNWYNASFIPPGSTSGLPNFYWKRIDANWVTCRIDLPPQAFDNKPSVRLRFSFAVDGNTNVGNGIAIDDVIIRGYNTAVKTYLEAACSPTLFDDLEGWWKPESLAPTYSNGQSVPNWPNSANILNAWTDLKNSVVSQQPLYSDNTADNINFNPVVKFDGINDFLIARQGFYNDEIFIVLKPKVAIQKGTNRVDVLMGEDYTEDAGNQDVTGISVNETSSRYTPNNDFAAYNQGPRTQYGRALLHPTLKYDRPVVFNGRINDTDNGMNLFLDAINLAAAPFPPTLSAEANPTTYHDIKNSKNILGRSTYFHTSGFLAATVAEIIIFSDKKTPADRDIINTYLALKYGANLGLHPNPAAGVPHVPYPYRNSSGSYIFLGQAPGHPDYGFTYNVCAIGRDDCMGLNQKQSYSVDPETYVTVGLGDIYTRNSENPNTFIEDKEYLIWGSTLEDLSNPTTDLAIQLGPAVTTFTSTTNRTWKFKEILGSATSDIKTVKLQIESAGLLIPYDASTEDQIVMIVSETANFSDPAANLETVFMTKNGIYHTCFYDFDGVKYVKFGVARETLLPLDMKFDGANDKIALGNTNNLNPSAFTISAWVKNEGNNNDNSLKTIVSKYNAGLNNGYAFGINASNRVQFKNKVGALEQNINSNTLIPLNQWRYVTATYDGINLKLYIDGILDNTALMAPPVANTHTFSVGSNYVSKTDIRHVFFGNLDELRMFNIALTETEIRFIMNQELNNVGTIMRGAVLPSTIPRNDLGTKNWSALTFYYNFNSYLGTHINDLSNSRLRGSLVDRTGYLIGTQTAPLPYVTAQNGNMSVNTTFENGNTQYLPNTNLVVNGVSTEVTWNIVKTKHDVTFDNANQRLNLLGLISESNTLSIANDSKLEVSHYLKLNGAIDLVNYSQLVQPLNSELDVTSSGFLERDTYGQLNRYNYNYHSSPVSFINNTTINSGFSVNSMLKDARNPLNVRNMLWTNSVDGDGTTDPMTISRRWLYKFVNTASAYANWAYVNENDAMLTAEGFTMKGNSNVNGTQTYTYKGKPNNGNISLTIGPNNLSLMGNPYPSAIDVNKFILQNATKILGTLYFWEHSSINNTHILRNYLGGYSAINLTGGVAPVVPAGIGGLGGVLKRPKQFIPIGQGFFVNGSPLGGTVLFTNDMRSFKKETDLDSTPLLKSSPIAATSELSSTDKKLRFEILFPQTHRRELLLGFMENKATKKYEPLYDADLLDAFPTDISFSVEDKKLIIQGTEAFDKGDTYPLTITVAKDELTTFKIIETENYDESLPVYIHDKALNSYHDIKKDPYTTLVQTGTSKDRFEVTFEKKYDLENDDTVRAIIYYNSTFNSISIFNDQQDLKLESIQVVDLQGKRIMENNDLDNSNHLNHLPVQLATGIYIANLQTNKGIINAKLVVN